MFFGRCTTLIWLKFYDGFILKTFDRFIEIWNGFVVCLCFVPLCSYIKEKSMRQRLLHDSLTTEWPCVHLKLKIWFFFFEILCRGRENLTCRELCCIIHILFQWPTLIIDHIINYTHARFLCLGIRCCDIRCASNVNSNINSFSIHCNLSTVFVQLMYYM